jgi:hypothetical protein
VTRRSDAVDGFRLAYDPLFLPVWSDRVDDWFADAQVRMLPGIGHFIPIEAPEALASPVRERLA